MGVSLSDEIAKIGVFVLACLKLLPKFTQLASNLALVNSGKFSIPIVYDDLIKIDKQNNKKHKKIKNKYISIVNNDFLSLKFKDVDFSYKNSKNKTINNLNLEINSKNIYGIYWSSGAGKTTFVDIFLKFLEPTNVTILYNNKIL